MLGSRCRPNRIHVTLVAFILLATLFWLSGFRLTRAEELCTTFPETGKSVCGKFLQYWNEHGGVTQQGFPVSDLLQERSEVDGKTYQVQYFERALFELHTENPAPNDVLLALLGTSRYLEYYGPGGAGSQSSDLANPHFFAETGHTIGGSFLHLLATTWGRATIWFSNLGRANRNLEHRRQALQGTIFPAGFI